MVGTTCRFQVKDLWVGPSELVWRCLMKWRFSRKLKSTINPNIQSMFQLLPNIWQLVHFLSAHSKYLWLLSWGFGASAVSGPELVIGGDQGWGPLESGLAIIRSGLGCSLLEAYWDDDRSFERCIDQLRQSYCVSPLRSTPFSPLHSLRTELMGSLLRFVRLLIESFSLDRYLFHVWTAASVCGRQRLRPCLSSGSLLLSPHAYNEMIQHEWLPVAHRTLQTGPVSCRGGGGSGWWWWGGGGGRHTNSFNLKVIQVLRPTLCFIRSTVIPFTPGSFWAVTRQRLRMTSVYHKIHLNI